MQSACITAKMAFTHSRSVQCSGLGAELDTTFYTEWHLSCSVFPRMHLRRVWESHQYVHPEKEETVQPADMSLGDADDSGFISDLDYSPSGRLLAASTSSNCLFLLDPNLGTVVKSFYKPHKSAICKVLFVGEYQFVSGSADATVGYWDIRHPKKALNFLDFHTRPIKSLNYFPNSEILISSCQEGVMRFSHLPSFSVNSENSDISQGILLKCPGLSQCYFSEPQKIAVISNNTGTLFIIRNLSVMHIREDLPNIVLDDTSAMQLCWFKPNCLPSKRNRAVVVNSSEYCPVESASVQNIHHLSIPSIDPIALMRIKTSRNLRFVREVKEWTCVCRLREDVPTSTDDDDVMQYMQMYGSNIVDGTLLYAKEETRYDSLRDKQPSISRCGRVIASPDKHGIRLLKFSRDMDMCLSHLDKNVDSLFQMSGDDWCASHTPLGEITHLPADSSVLCCKFSPTDQTQIAVGDSDGRISFYSPQL